MRLTVLWTTLFGCTQPTLLPTETAGPDGPLLTSLTFSNAELLPEFTPDQAHYAVRVSDLGDEATVVTVQSGCSGAEIGLTHGTVDGDVLAQGMSNDAFELVPRHRVVVDVRCGDREGQWSVAVLPEDLPDIWVENLGEADAGYFFLANFNFLDQPADIGRYKLIVDNAGIPVWFQRSEVPSFDFRASPDGRLTVISLGADGMEGQVLGSGFTVEETWSPGRAADGRPLNLDVHEFQLLDDGRILTLGLADRSMDLEPWGGPSNATVVDHVVQIFEPDGELSFEWSSQDAFDFDELPPGYVARARAGQPWEYAHVNSVFVDPDDGNLVISAPIPDQVIKVGLADRPGQRIWKWGGPFSDIAFIDDARSNGWIGFAGQHCAVPLGNRRILLFDNASEMTGATGDARAVEYSVDSEARTAERIREWAIADAGIVPAAGSVQRLDSGHTVVGWGSRGGALNQPVMTEFDAEGQPVLHLYLSNTQWTYRGFKHQPGPKGWQ